MRISDCSSDVCSSDLTAGTRSSRHGHALAGAASAASFPMGPRGKKSSRLKPLLQRSGLRRLQVRVRQHQPLAAHVVEVDLQIGRAHVELQSLMRISYAVFCLKKKKKNNNHEHATCIPTKK